MRQESREQSADDLSTALVEQIKALPELERTVFILRYVKGLSTETVAWRLQLTAGEVRELAVRAIILCRRGLGEPLDRYMEIDVRES